MKIGILEDDNAQAELLVHWLEEQGHELFHSENCQDFTHMFNREPLDLAVLDWELPDHTGLEVLQLIRQELNSRIPIIFATQRDSEADVVAALKAGADDYLIKPLRHAELVARVEALGRRAGLDRSSEILRLDHVSINTATRQVLVNNEEVKLTQKDYQVACCVIRNMGKLLSREYLLKQVWGVDANLNTRTVDMHISRIRRSLKIEPDTGYVIKTIYQHGYRLERVA